MITEDDARRLLQAAADTVDVDPAGPLDVDSRARRWPVLIAAAAVLAVLLSSALLATRHSHDPEPTPLPDPIVTIPSVLGYDESEATSLLMDRGLEVTVERQSSCDVPPGLAMSTSPPTGSVPVDGSEVRLVASTGPAATTLCTIGDVQAYEFLRFARGTGPAPRFSDHVSIVAGGRRTTLTAREARDPGRWPCGADDCTSPLTAFVADADRPWPTTTGGKTTYLAPSLASATIGQLHDLSEAGCGVPLPRALEGQQLATYFVRSDDDGPLVCPRVALTVYRLDGAVTAVYLQSAATDPPTKQATIPSVLGSDTAEATERLRELGFEVTTSTDKTCGPPRGLALKTDPSQQVRVPAGTTVTLTVSGGTDPCPFDPDTDLAWQTLRFARGLGPAPDFADRVDVFDQGSLVRTLTAEQASTLATWRCPRSAPCTGSAIGQLGADAERAWATDDSEEGGIPVLVTSLQDRTGADTSCPSFLGPTGVDPAGAVGFGIGEPTRATDGVVCPGIEIILHRDGGQPTGLVDAVAVVRAAGFREAFETDPIGTPPATADRPLDHLSRAGAGVTADDADGPALRRPRARRDGPSRSPAGPGSMAGLPVGQRGLRRPHLPRRRPRPVGRRPRRAHRRPSGSGLRADHAEPALRPGDRAERHRLEQGRRGMPRPGGAPAVLRRRGTAHRGGPGVGEP